MRTYDLRTAQLCTEDIVHPITNFSLSNTDEGSSIVAASCLDGIIRLWDTTQQQQKMKKRIFQKLHSSHKSNNYKVECTFTSNDEYVVSGSECGDVAIYPVDFNNITTVNNSDASKVVKGKEAAAILHKHTGPTTSVAACPQTKRPWLIVSASYDGSAVVWASQAQYDCCLLD